MAIAYRNIQHASRNPAAGSAFYQRLGNGSGEGIAIAVNARGSTGTAPYVVEVRGGIAALDQNTGAGFIPGGTAAIFEGQFHVGRSFGVRPQPGVILAVVDPGACTFYMNTVDVKIVVRNRADCAGISDFIGLIDNQFATQYTAVGAGAGGTEIDGDGVWPGAFRLRKRNSGAGATTATFFNSHIDVDVGLLGIVFLGGNIFRSSNGDVLGFGFFAGLKSGKRCEYDAEKQSGLLHVGMYLILIAQGMIEYVFG